ncbi:hypothetical protein BH09BAC3_BH09BAC3_15990 [soil metagenome]
MEQVHSLHVHPYNSLASGTMETSYLGLTPGVTYYISVDNYVGVGYRGTFSLCLSDVVDYDFKIGAADVTSLINGCSANAAYSTIGASADQAAGSCAPNGPNYNRWFKFTATASTYIDIQMKNGGAFGTMTYGWVTLWNGAGTQLACSQYNSLSSGTMETDFFGLTPGVTYYISVDNYVGLGYRGTFTLCLTDVPDYNYYEGATLLTNLNNWCSANATYSTVSATGDKSKGSCWNNGPNTNRWFKFVAITPNVTIQMQTGGAAGTLQYGYMALWQSNGTTQIACTQYVAQYSNLSISVASLVVGNTYYVSVDNYVGAGYTGTFKLCINNIGNTYYSRASAAWNVATTWSTIGYGGAAAASFPGTGDVALIQGYAINVSANQQVGQVDMDVAVANTSLTVDNASLTVNGLASMNNAGTNFNGAITIQNNGTMFVNDVLNLGRAGGNQSFGITVATGSSLTINKNFNWTMSAGSAFNNLLTVNGTGAVTVNRDVNLNSTGGPLTKLQFNNTSLFTVLRDINFTANAGGLQAIELNNTAKLKIARNMVRGATPFGSLTSLNSSVVEFNGTTNAQIIGGDAGSGGDSFSYMNVILNNTTLFTPQLSLGGATTINGDLTMTAGIVTTTAGNILNLKNATNTTIGSTACFVTGPMTYEVASSTANTVRNFPVGKSTSYRPLVLTVTHSTASSVIYTVEEFNTSAATLGYTLAPTTDRVSGLRYWRVTSSNQTNLTSAFVTLYYGYGTSDGVPFPANLTVVKNVGVGTTWVDIGKVSATAEPGNIVSGTFTTFCDFTLANLNGGGNPLPISLKSFEAHPSGNAVVLKWSTASELNNDYFTVERSKQGSEFTEVLKVKGAGTKPNSSEYSAIDEHPIKGTSYYRLRQTDYDGVSTLSKIVAVTTDPFAGTILILYPNPTEASNLNLKLSGFEENEELMVTFIDGSGRTHWSSILHVDATGEFSKAIKPPNSLAAGLYIVVVDSKNGTLRSKVIIK